VKRWEAGEIHGEIYGKSMENYGILSKIRGNL
jgi:hypothetical protein